MQDNAEVAVRVLGFEDNEGPVLREVVAKASHPIVELAVGAPEVELVAAVSEVDLGKQKQFEGIEHGGLAQVILSEQGRMLVDSNLGVRVGGAVHENQLFETKGIKAQIHWGTPR